MFQDNQLTTIFYDLGKLAGIISFICLSLLIFIGDITKYLSKYFDPHKIKKFLKKFSLFTLIFVLAHPIFFMLSNSAVLIYLIPDFTLLPLAFGIISFYIFICIILAFKFRSKIKTKNWIYIKLLIYILFFFSLYHAVNWGSSYGFLGMKVVYGFLLSLVLFGLFYKIYFYLNKKTT